MSSASSPTQPSWTRPRLTSSDGVLCVPALAGLAAPWWAPDATASFTGMTLASQRGHLVRAVLEGIAAQVTALTGLVATDLGAT